MGMARFMRRLPWRQRTREKAEAWRRSASSFLFREKRWSVSFGGLNDCWSVGWWMVCTGDGEICLVSKHERR